MNHLLRGTSVTLEATFYKDGNPTDADGPVTVTVRKADGTTLSTGAATRPAPPAAGVYHYALAPQTNLNVLAVEWSGVFSGQTQTLYTEAEIVGNHLFTEYQARNWSDKALGDLTKYTDGDISAARARITDELEQRTGISWIPRFGRSTMDGLGSIELQLPRDLIKVLSVKVGGAAWTQPQIDALHAYRSGRIVSAATLWPAGYRNVVVEYEYGKERLESGVDRIALIWAYNSLTESRFDDRVTFMTDASGESYRLTPVPIEVTDWIAAHRDKSRDFASVGVRGSLL